jgi:hypothetical protein
MIMQADIYLPDLTSGQTQTATALVSTNNEKWYSLVAEPTSNELLPFYNNNYMY